MANKKKLGIALLIFILLFYVILEKGGLQPQPGDENVYFYMGKAISDGGVPYKDFFYAHPPLHIYILAFLIKLFGVNIAALKFFSLFAIVVSAFFLYKSSMKIMHRDDSEYDSNSVYISLVAVILFLFSFEVMFKATYSLGEEYTLMFLMIGFYLALKSRFFYSGIFLGAASLTRLYAVVPSVAIIFFFSLKKLIDRKPKDFFYIIGGVAVSFAFVMALLYVFIGERFIDSVIGYHLMKPKFEGQRIMVYKSLITENWILFIAFIASFFASGKKTLQLPYLIAFSYSIFFLLLRVPSQFYFIIAMPFMAIIGAYAVFKLIGRIKIKYLKYALTLIIAGIFAWNYSADAMFLEKTEFSKFTHFENMLEKVSSTPMEQTIFGDSSVVPLLALKSGRKISLNFIDSNEMRFTSGLENFFLFEKELDKENVSYIILKEGWGLNIIREFNQYAVSRCSLEEEYPSVIEGNFLMYKCDD